MGDLVRYQRPKHRCDTVTSREWDNGDIWRCSCGRLWRWKADARWRYGGRWVPCSKIRLVFAEILRPH